MAARRWADTTASPCKPASCCSGLSARWWSTPTPSRPAHRRPCGSATRPNAPTWPSDYGGDLLPGARYEAWTEPHRERLRALYLDLLRASAQWERLAQHEPTDEAAHRALMQRELEAGNRAAALRWYSRLRESLQQSLGVTPDARTEAVYERCVAGLQAVGPAFVGRSQVLGQVTAWLGMPVGTRPGGIVLRGPAGIGKSALCGEIGAQARRRGWTVHATERRRHGPGLWRHGVDCRTRDARRPQACSTASAHRPAPCWPC